MENVEDSNNERRYFIDLAWYQENRRDFNTFVVSRMCYPCQQRVGQEVEERVPTVDRKSNRVVFESRTSVFGAHPFAIIRDCCAKTKGYITGRTPLAEALFRLFLANANQPLTVEQTHQQLREWLAYSDAPRDISLETLKRLLENDRFYGFKAIEVPRLEGETMEDEELGTPNESALP